MIGEGTDALLARIRQGSAMTTGQKLRLAMLLSVPAVIAQLSSIVMQYIDASMVGHLGAEASASIGLVSTSTWLFSGLCGAAATGFSVQVAHRIGAGDMHGARAVLRQSMIATFTFSLMLALIGVAISDMLPVWLGGDASICGDSPRMSFHGNMKVPSMLGVTMCALDVVFNFLLIFPSHNWDIGFLSLTIPGAGLGVKGAALGTAAAETVVAAILIWYLSARSTELKLTGEHGRFLPRRETIRKALNIGLPMGVEHVLICGAQILTTVIVAPLGVFAIAANSFAVTAESLCYMPGYGIADAATTLVGQSIGAKNRTLTRSFARITVGMGMGVMGVMGVLMYIFAPEIIGLMSPVTEIRNLGVMALRVEPFAERVVKLFSIWAVRLTLAALLAPTMGLKGVWVAMCIELCFRGLIFLIYLKWERWMRKVKPKMQPDMG